MLKITSHLTKQAENWTGPGPAFDNAPEVPGAGNPDLFESGHQRSNPTSEFQVGDWVRVKPIFNDSSDNRIGRVMEVGHDRFGPCCLVYFPRGGGITQNYFPQNGLTKLRPEEVDPAYID